MYRRFFWLLCLVFALTLRSGTTSPVSLVDLSWMAGSWQGIYEGGTLEEHWLPPSGGTMIGASRLVVGRRTLLAEFLNVEEKRDEILLTVILPKKRLRPMRLVESGANRAVFEDSTHRPPDLLTYEREGDTLRIVLTKVRKGKPSRVEYVLHRGAPGTP
jgi:hypothetical protein